MHNNGYLSYSIIFQLIRDIQEKVDIHLDRKEEELRKKMMKMKEEEIKKKEEERNEVVQNGDDAKVEELLNKMDKELNEMV